MGDQLDLDETAFADLVHLASYSDRLHQIVEAAGPRAGIMSLACAIAKNVGVPIDDWVERKFIRLRDQWKSQRGHESSSARLAMHPAYLKIIGMGQDAVPLLLRELACEPDLWFLALRSITEENPVPDEIRGNVSEMAKAWLEWGTESGFKW